MGSEQFSKFASIHVGHYDVRQQQIDGAAMPFEQAHGFDSVLGGEHVVAMLHQRVTHQVTVGRMAAGIAPVRVK